MARVIARLPSQGAGEDERATSAPRRTTTEVSIRMIVALHTGYTSQRVERVAADGPFEGRDR